MEGRLATWQEKFKLAIEKNEPNEIRDCLSELKQIRGNDTVPERQPSEGERDTFELDVIRDGTRSANGILRTQGGDGILEALSNSKETFARHFLRSENPRESAANLRGLGYFTPSFVGNSELVRCMIRNGFRFHEPDTSLCDIDDQFAVEGQLHLLNRYLAISDPVYLSACFLEDTTEAEDPVVRLFQLGRTFRYFAAKDYEFASEYDALRQRCKQFGVALLDQCRNKREIRCTLDSAVGREDNAGSTFPLNMLHQAIIDGNDEFVTHSYSQLLLNKEVYGGVPWLERKSRWLIFGFSVLIMAVFPLAMAVFTFINVVLSPSHQLSRVVSSPMMKYLTSFSSYILFLALLIYSAFQPMKDFLAFSVADWLIFIWMVGLLFDIVTDVLHQMKQLHTNLNIPWWKAFKLQCSSGWNAVGVLMVVMFLMYHVLWLAGYLGLTKQEHEFSKTGGIPRDPHSYAVLVSFSFNGFGFLFAFAYMLSFSSVNPITGPLQYALIELVKEVVKFAIFFLTLFFGFTFSFTKLFLQYEQSRHHFVGSNATNTTPDAGGGKRFTNSMYASFWALFGQIDLEFFETTPPYDVIHDTDLTLFGVYNVVTVLVALNILIAILNKKYDDITNNLDVAWKFARTRTWMKWINKKEPIPPPFNLLSMPLKFLLEKFRKSFSYERCKVLRELIGRYLVTHKYLETGTKPEENVTRGHGTGAENKGPLTSFTTNV